MSDVRVVVARGDGVARGQQIGAELGDLIRRSVDYYHVYLDRRGISSRELQELLTPYLAAAETNFPDMTDVLKGMSMGALVPVMELFAINAFEELEPLLEQQEGQLLFLQRKEGYVKPPPERCSSVAIRTSDGGTSSTCRPAGASPWRRPRSCRASPPWASTDTVSPKASAV
jgi:hypothetical protein